MHEAYLFYLAEKERFELSNGVNRYTISNRARSTSYATSPRSLFRIGFPTRLVIISQRFALVNKKIN